MDTDLDIRQTQPFLPSLTLVQTCRRHNFLGSGGKEEREENLRRSREREEEMRRGGRGGERGP